MANGKITRKEIAEDKIFKIGKDYADGLQPAIDANKKWLETFPPIKKAALDYAKIQEQIKRAENRTEFLKIKEQEEVLRVKATNAIKTEQAALVSVQKVKQAIIDTEKKGLTLTNQKIRSQQQAIKLTAQEKLELSILNKGKKEAAVLSSKLSTEYEKQSVRLLQLRRRYKDVALTQGESSKQAKSLQKQISSLDATLKRVDANVGQFQRSVGNYGKAMNSAKAAARSLASALGLVGGAFLVVQVARDATKVLKDFEKQNATLSAILQVEKEDMKNLSDESIRLGSTTVKTAGEVTALQIAYARLGFSQKEIIDLTEGTINGSIAMNAELDATANLTGAVVNTFDDLSTTDAPRILDIMSLATAKSALNFQKLETGIPIVAGAANAAGVPFTKLIALMGKLSDSGIDVSTSSTALRNIFIESAAQGLDYGQILEKIKGSQDKLTASNDEFGKRAAVSAAVLAQNIDATNELDIALNKAAGTAERMANKELDTLDGSLKLLRSAWEGYILGANESGGASDKLKSIVKTLADNLDKILNTIVAVVKGFVLYKAIILASSLITRGYAIATTALRVAKIALAGGIGKATIAMRAFNLATKSNPIGLVLGLLAGGVATWLAFRDGTKEAADEMKNFNNEVDRLERVSDRFSKALDNVTEGRQRANAAVLEQFNIEDRLEASLKKQGVNQDRINSALKLVRTSREKDIEAMNRQISTSGTFTESQTKQIRSAIKISQTLTKIVNENETIANNKFKEKEKRIKAETDKERKARLAVQKQLRDDAFKLDSFLLKQDIDTQKKIADNKDNSYNERFAAIEEQANLELELAKRTAENKFDFEKNFSDKDIEALLEGGEVSKNALKQISDEELKIIQEFQDKKKEIQESQEGSEDGLDVEDVKAQAAIKKAEKEKELNNELELENDLFNAKQGIYENEVNAAELREQRIAEIKKKYALEALNVQVKAIEELLGAEELSAEQRAEFEAKLSALKLQISNISTQDFIESNDKEVESTQEKVDKILSISSDLANVLGDLANSILAGKIQKIDEEIEKEDEKYEKLLDNENLSERQRKALEDKREKDREVLEKKKAKEQRKQAILAKAITALTIGLTTASAVIAALAPPPVGLGPIAGIPLAITTGALGAIQLAAALSAPIPKFAKGTENASKGWALVDELQPEVHTDKDGNIKSTGSDKGANLRYLEQGDKIYKSHADYDRMMRASILTSVAVDNKKLNDFQAKHVFNFNNKELVNEQRLTREAIGRIKTSVNLHNHTNIGDDLRFLAELNKI